MSKNRKAGIAASAVTLALSLFLMIGVLFIFHACGPKADGSRMNCHNAQMLVFYSGIGLSVFSLCAMLIPNKVARLISSAIVFLGGLFSALVPGVFVHLCMMSTMRCRSIMQPAVVGVSAAVMAAALVTLAINIASLRKGGTGFGLAFKNVVRRPLRSIGLIILTVMLSFTALAGTLVVSGLQSGLSSLEERLGADIMVVPYEAATKQSLEDIILQGNTGYFYMDNSKAEKVKSIEGVGQVSEQYYLATTTSSCCSYKIQIIGFDPETDFTIQPWVELSYKDDLKDGEVFVGNTLNAFAGDEITFYGVDVKVAARLEKTGTYLDTSVYANKNTVKMLIEAAKEKGFKSFDDVNPDTMVSCLMINVADGYNVEEVKNHINMSCKGVKAVMTQNMIDDVTSKMTGIADIAGFLIVVVWVLVLIILVIAVTMLSNERKNEFAVLRIIGASKGTLAGLLIRESFITAITGSVIGAGIALGASFIMSGAVESILGMPFLLPNLGALAIIIAVVIVASIVVSSAASAICAYRISHVDPALVLRGRN